ncbi:nucleoside triphosphate pyrophosphohydrolase [Peribacillus alkalitolerans]|uniref:nucleoside triphosphate pyrophosphohydrolase n=1 Tax=Peribacillus alkalitolerans TaxID=1550385 RepID=UPI0013D7ED94|nr:nucleoside triphosphate pyrophosphohydrolase [Peribacillus alkalitolerans]
MPIYNKLVRDLIPEIIASSGKQFSFKVLNEVEYVKELKAKCYEEIKEYTSTENDKDALEELADLLEIINSLAACHGASITDLEEVRKMKAETRGGFQKRIFLEEVFDNI